MLTSYALCAEFSCLICRHVMNLPVTTPCAHNFCKSCFEVAFAGKTAIRERDKGGRTLRSQKNVLHCPCPTDISDFLQNLQVWHAFRFPFAEFSGAECVVFYF